MVFTLRTVYQRNEYRNDNIGGYYSDINSFASEIVRERALFTSRQLGETLRKQQAHRQELEEARAAADALKKLKYSDRRVRSSLPCLYLFTKIVFSSRKARSRAASSLLTARPPTLSLLPLPRLRLALTLVRLPTPWLLTTLTRYVSSYFIQTTSAHVQFN